MIIGNNSDNKKINMNASFQKKINANNNLNKIHNESSTSSISKKNVFTKDIFSIAGGDTSNPDDMYTKSIAMLNDRLEKGLITMEEFTKKCSDIAKKRSKR